jgi:hypothetical protein
MLAPLHWLMQDGRGKMVLACAGRARGRGGYVVVVVDAAYLGPCGIACSPAGGTGWYRLVQAGTGRYGQVHWV